MKIYPQYKADALKRVDVDSLTNMRIQNNLIGKRQCCSHFTNLRVKMDKDLQIFILFESFFRPFAILAGSK